MPKTNFKLVAMETTQFWIEEAIQVYGRVYDIYLVDTNSRTYLCEMTPSYCLYYVDSVCENELTDEQQESFLVANSENDPVTYTHSLYRWPTMVLDDDFNIEYAKEDDKEDKERYDDDFEEVLEYVRGNQMFVDPFTQENEGETK